VHGFYIQATLGHVAGSTKVTASECYHFTLILFLAICAFFRAVPQKWW
jgi:hypothetical protein